MLEHLDIREYGGIRAKTPSIQQETQKRTRETLKKMKYWMDDFKNPSISYSTGVDSTTLLHLILKIKPDIIVFYHDYGATYPSTYEMLAKLEKEWNLNLYRIVSETTILDIYKEYGAASNIKPGSWTKPLTIFQNNMNRAVEKFKVDASFRGLLNEESVARQRIRDQVYYDKNLTICYPLLNWTKKDVWDYTFINNLPYNDVYDKQDGIPFYKRRTGIWAGDSAIEYGRWVWLKKHYPELYNKLKRDVPEVGGFI